MKTRTLVRRHGRPDGHTYIESRHRNLERLHYGISTYAMQAGLQLIPGIQAEATRWAPFLYPVVTFLIAELLSRLRRVDKGVADPGA